MSEMNYRSAIFRDSSVSFGLEALTILQQTGPSAPNLEALSDLILGQLERRGSIEEIIMQSNTELASDDDAALTVGVRRKFRANEERKIQLARQALKQLPDETVITSVFAVLNAFQNNAEVVEQLLFNCMTDYPLLPNGAKAIFLMLGIFAAETILQNASNFASESKYILASLEEMLPNLAIDLEETLRNVPAAADLTYQALNLTYQILPVGALRLVTSLVKAGLKLPLQPTIREILNEVTHSNYITAEELVDSIIKSAMPPDSNIQSIESRLQEKAAALELTESLRGDSVSPLNKSGRQLFARDCIIYEDHDLLVVNKPAGLLVHGVRGHFSGTHPSTLVDELRSLGIPLAFDDGRNIEPGLVHRIDRYTSGLMVVAKTEEAFYGLSAQLQDKSLGRIYWAFVWGCPQQPNARIDVPIGPSPIRSDKMVVDDAGKSAATNYFVRESYNGLSLVECRLETGRTHQIRVHLAHIGCPLLGDIDYDKDYRKRNRILPSHRPGQALHSIGIHFIHPITKEKMNFETDLPNDLHTLRAVLKFAKNCGLNYSPL